MQNSLNNLAVLYLTQGKYEQAEPLYIQALELRKQLLGVNHPQLCRKFEQFSSYSTRVKEGTNKQNSFISKH